MAEYTVEMNWDDEAKMWVATSPDMMGVAFESGSYDALIEKLKLAVPELLEMNEQPPAAQLRVVSQRNIVPFNHIPSAA